MKKPVKILFIVLIIIFVCIFAYAAYKIIVPVFGNGGYYQSNKNYESMQQSVVSNNNGKKPSNNTVDENDGKNFHPKQEDEVCPISVDFDALAQTNPDVIGWLYCPDTVINYPICQCDDNMWYLHRDINGNYSSYGTLFEECLCMRGFDNYNNIIYGHHMNDGKMFAKLIDYSYQSYYDEHPIMYLLTPEMNYRIELFTGYVTPMTSDTYLISFETDQSYSDWMGKMLEMSKFTQDRVKLSTEYPTITLSTCTYDYDDARFVVQGKLIPIK